MVRWPGIITGPDGSGGQSMSASTDKPMGQRKPKQGVAGEVPWGPVLSGPCQDNKPEYTIPGRAAADSATLVTSKFDDRVQQGPFAVRTKFADGHHPENRDSLDQQIGQGTAHEHDDWKRSPPEVIDQDAPAVTKGWYAGSRAPDDKKNALKKPGDQLGP